MQESAVTLQLDKLFELQQQLEILLEKEQYEQFHEQQVILSMQIKTLIKSNSTETLSSELSRLKQLEKNLNTLKETAEQCFNQLKHKSLLQRRNKNRIRAYK